MKSIALHLTLLFSISLPKGITANENSPWLDEKFVNQKTVGLSKLEGSNPAQWRVIWKTDPANKATVSWTTAKVGKNHLVHYDLKSRKGLPKNYTYKKVSDRNGRFSGSGGEHFHHARLAELKPSTTYWFVIESDGHVINRTVPIRNEKKDSTGVVSVGEGDLGVP